VENAFTDFCTFIGYWALGAMKRGSQKKLGRDKKDIGFSAVHGKQVFRVIELVSTSKVKNGHGFNPLVAFNLLGHCYHCSLLPLQVRILIFSKEINLCSRIEKTCFIES